MVGSKTKQVFLRCRLSPDLTMSADPPYMAVSIPEATRMLGDRAAASGTLSRSLGVNKP